MRATAGPPRGPGAKPIQGVTSYFANDAASSS
jgi:hypothetical protein